MHTVAGLFSGLLLFVALLGGIPTGLFAEESQAESLPMSNEATSLVDSNQGRRIGAPQVLEIPVQDLSLSSVSPSPPQPPPLVRDGVQGDNSSEQGLSGQASALVTGGRRNYLGVLYATAEEGPVGVKVLSVVPGSPADRAGFEGVNSPPPAQSNLLKAAIVVLAMSPAGPFAIPLAIAHDMYTHRQAPGDLIVAVGDRPVHDAQEFSDAMRPYQPGETVTFSVIRGGKPLQIAVQLEEEPS